jgi:hypothetical protein
VPNLLEPDAASTLVVSQDVDLVVPAGRHGEVKRALESRHGLLAGPRKTPVIESLRSQARREVRDQARPKRGSPPPQAGPW